jgi:hypothetical protein
MRILSIVVARVDDYGDVVRGRVHSEVFEKDDRSDNEDGEKHV